MVPGQHEPVVRLIDTEMARRVPGGPDGLEAPFPEFDGLPVLEHAVRFRVHPEAPAPIAIAVVGRGAEDQVPDLLPEAPG